MFRFRPNFLTILSAVSGRAIATAMFARTCFLSTASKMIILLFLPGSVHTVNSSRCENRLLNLRASIFFLLCLLCIVIGCKPSIPPPKPLSELTPVESHGHAVYQAHCVACHNDRNSDPRNGPGLAGMYKKQYLPSGAPANDERVRATILHGRNNMPALGNTMDEQELADLMAYLHTL